MMENATVTATVTTTANKSVIPMMENTSVNASTGNDSMVSKLTA